MTAFLALMYTVQPAAVAAPEGTNVPHTNHLVNETSPYLLQHVYNPVDWFPWGEQALEKARAEDKPIFLSIGYAACHWCHVMERESFENEAIAACLNDHFVAIKVDREERPDLDEIYMAAVMAMNGQGGWPMTVFLTPGLEPFYGGTYYPPVDSMGRPGFMTVLHAIADAWENRRGEISQSAAGLTEHVRSQMSAALPPGTLTSGLIEGASAHFERSFDPNHGGWGDAPKFPSSATIGLLLRAHQRTGNDSLLHMATFTLDRMALGGMYDHLGGGFHRYSVDAQWLVPHFEKMLYDNAQLSPVYLEAFQATGDGFYARVVRETLDYELKYMRDGLGAFHATEDADSEGEEGKFYVWTAAEIVSILGEEDARFFNTHYRVRPEGNFSSHESYHRGQNILHLAARPPADVEVRLAPMRAKLLAARDQRTRPGLDDKVLTSWNALLISSLAQAAGILEEPRYRVAAEDAGRFLLHHMMRDGALLRTHRKGESRIEGYLDDYTFTANAFVDLYEATFDPEWLEEGGKLAEAMTARFWDEQAGTFYFTAETHQDLIMRTRPSYDGAEPSGNSVAAQALLRLAIHLDRPRYRDMARRVLEANAALMERAPQGFPRMLCALDFLLDPPREFAIVGPPDSDDVAACLRAIHERFLPNKVLALGPADDTKLPLLAGKTMPNGRPAVYICRDYSCEQPLDSPEALAARLDKAAP